ncbi:hypothetical protein NQ315_002600 [Exocentrus adspersus]|uniref:Uncharacterized protein n=1 Tax=Exocentrus adspersus TaxID=1586481 RepID=A0AAV8VV12_9CUCU|nr:hypothetical protein NQ315_002600 [Exocentrus adspersus]
MGFSCSYSDVRSMTTALAKEGLNTDRWSEYHNLICNDSVKVSTISYLPFLNNPHTEFDTIYTSMLRLVQLAESLHQKHIIITEDLAIYSKAQEILWNEPPAIIDKVTLQLGGMHLTMAFIASIGFLYRDGDLSNMLPDTDVYATNSCKQILEVAGGHLYAKWVPIYLKDMSELKSKDPQMYEYLKPGNFVVKKTTEKKFNCVASDMALEQSRRKALDEIQQSLSNFLENGKNKCEHFIENVLITGCKSFWEPAKQGKVLKFEPYGIVGSPQIVDSLIIDGMVLIQGLNEKACSTFNELAFLFLKQILLLNRKYEALRITVVFDRYDESVKSLERRRRGDFTDSHPYAVSGNRKVVKFRNFLKVSENKRSLLKLVSDYLLEHSADQCAFTLTLSKKNIPINNLVGFSSNTTSVMIGQYNSIFSHLKAELPEIAFIKCSCHMIHLCASKACLELPRSVEDLLRNIGANFSRSFGRREKLKEFHTEINP